MPSTAAASPSSVTVSVSTTLLSGCGVAPLLLGDGRRSKGSGSVDTISPLLEFSTEVLPVLSPSRDSVTSCRGSGKISCGLSPSEL